MSAHPGDCRIYVGVALIFFFFCPQDDPGVLIVFDPNVLAVRCILGSVGNRSCLLHDVCCELLSLSHVKCQMSKYGGLLRTEYRNPDELTSMSKQRFVRSPMATRLKNTRLLPPSQRTLAQSWIGMIYISYLYSLNSHLLHN